MPCSLPRSNCDEEGNVVGVPPPRDLSDLRRRPTFWLGAGIAGCALMCRLRIG